MATFAVSIVKSFPLFECGSILPILQLNHSDKSLSQTKAEARCRRTLVSLAGPEEKNFQTSLGAQEVPPLAEELLTIGGWREGE